MTQILDTEMFGITKSENGWIFWTRDILSPGVQGGGGTSATFCPTEAEAKAIYERFVAAYGLPPEPPP